MIQEVDTIVCRCTWNCFRIELMSSLNHRAKLFIVDLRISQQLFKSAHFVVTEVALVLVDTYAYDHIDCQSVDVLALFAGQADGTWTLYDAWVQQNMGANTPPWQYNSNGDYEYDQELNNGDGTERGLRSRHRPEKRRNL